MFTCTQEIMCWEKSGKTRNQSTAISVLWYNPCSPAAGQQTISPLTLCDIFESKLTFPKSISVKLVFFFGFTYWTHGEVIRKVMYCERHVCLTVCVSVLYKQPFTVQLWQMTYRIKTSFQFQSDFGLNYFGHKDAPLCVLISPFIQTHCCQSDTLSVLLFHAHTCLYKAQ